MGKVIKTALEVVGIAALAVVTAGTALGVGIGFSIGASLSATVTALGSALGVSASVVAGAALTGLQFVAGAFSSVPKPDAQQTALKSPRSPRVAAYGRSKLFGTYVLYITGPRGTAFDVYAIHDGKIDGYEVYYIGDDVVANTQGTVGGTGDGAYSGGNVAVFSRLGEATEAPYSNINEPSGGIWTDNHRGDNVASALVVFEPVKSKDYIKVYPNGQPSLSVVARWQPCFDWRDPAQSVSDRSTWKWTENACLHLAHYKLMREKSKKLSTEAYPSPEELQRAWDRYFAPTLSYWTDAADDCDIPVPLKGFITTLGDVSNAGDDVVFVADNNGLVPGLLVTISYPGDVTKTEERTVVSVSGPSVAITPDLEYTHPVGSTMSWSSDPANPASEPRYRGLVSHNLTDAHKATTARLTACFDGWIAPRADGALVVYSGRFYTPTVSITPEEIVSCTFREGINDEDAVNSIAVSYFSKDNKWQSVATDNWEDEDNILQTGQVKTSALSDDVPSWGQARRLAKRKLARLMAPYQGTVITTSAGRIARGQRYINLNYTEGGTEFFNGPVEITALTRNLSTGGVTFQWVAVDPNIDAWNPSTEEGNPAATGDVIASEPLETPVITSAVAEFGFDSGAGTQGVCIDIVATAPNRSDVTWFARTRTVGAAVWGERSYTDIAQGSTVEIVTEFVSADTMVECEVSYQVGDGRVSEWSNPSTVVDTSTAGLAPAQVSSLSATGGAGTGTTSWQNPTSAGLSYVRLYRGTTTTFSAATQVGADRPAALGATDSVTTTGLAAGTYYDWVRTYNSSGTGGTPRGPVSFVVT